MTKTAVLLVSFGTTYPESRHETDDSADTAFASAFPEATLFHAYTSVIVRQRVKENEGVTLDDVPAALQHILDGGFKDLVVQSLHIIPGIEYHRLCDQLVPFNSKFEHVSVGKPLLTSFDDFQTVVGWLKMVDTDDDTKAVVFMGHGTGDHAFTTYACLDHMLMETNVFMGAVESYPGIDTMIAELKRRDVQSVVVRPFMMVSGNHVHHDMTSDSPKSWTSRLTAAGFKVEPEFSSLANVLAILTLFTEHAKQAVEAQHE